MVAWSTRLLWSSVANLWKGYKYRFVPWIVFNVKTAKPLQSQIPIPQFPASSSQKSGFDIHLVSQKEDLIMSDADLAKQLSLLLAKFNEFETISKNKFTNAADKYLSNLKIMNDIFGFSVRTGTSRAGADAGLGVFVAGGTVKPGAIVGLYPGTVYKAYEPMFFPSINNSFIFRCSDGVHVDGKWKGFSKSIYKSCAARDKFNLHLPCCDESWMTPYPLNPLNIGHYVNNKSETVNHNVVYQECFLSLPLESGGDTPCLDVPLWRFLPNVWFSPGPDTRLGIKVIPLVAVRKIETGEELLSSYFTVVRS